MRQADTIVITTKPRTARRRRPGRSLSDDAMLLPHNRLVGAHAYDPDFELFTYPDLMDQTHIGDADTGWAAAFAHDDMEIDDGV